MSRNGKVFAVLFFFVVNLNAQGIKIRDLPALISTPASGDILPIATLSPTTTKKVDLHTLASYFATDSLLVPSTRTITCMAPLLCAGSTSMDLSADVTISTSGPNPNTFNVACVGTGADTTNINAALVALQAVSGCGVLHLSGNCLMSNSIINNPGSSTTCPVVIEGDGRNSSNITFSNCASGSGDCIFLASQAAMGGGRNDGSGVRRIRINPASGTVGVHLKNLQGFDLSDIYVEGGATALKVEESRFGHAQNLYAHGWTSEGINIVGETYASNWYTDVDLVSTSGSNGFNYTKSGTTDAGGIYLTNLVVNGTLSGVGILFTTISANNVFVFCSHCVADGNFTGDGVRLKNIIMAYLTEMHVVNQASSAGSAALALDGVFGVNVMGGLFYGATGTGGADISLKNAVSRVVIDGVRLEGNQQAIKVDSTTHSVDLRPSFYLSSTLTNDPTKIVPATTLYGGGRTLYTGTTKPSMFGMISPAGSLAQYSGVDSLGVRKYYADNGSTVLETLSQAGAAVFTSTVAGSNLSGTNTGDQVVPVNTTATASNWFSAYNSSTGAYTKSRPAMTDLSDAATWEGWTDAGTTINTTTSTDKVGIGTSSPGALLSVSSNTATLPTPTTGAVAQFSAPDGTATRLEVDAYGSGPVFEGRQAQGTAASPTATQSTNTLFNLTGFGYGATGFSSGGRAFIQAQANENWTDSAQGTKLVFGTTINGTTSALTQFTIQDGGHLISGGTAPTVACTGTGTSPSAPAIDTNGTDTKFTVTINTGTGSPGSTGTCTVTFAKTYGAVSPIVCMLVKGATAWGNTSQIQETTESASAPVFTWTNSAGGVVAGLTISTSYKFSCVTFG